MRISAARIGALCFAVVLLWLLWRVPGALFFLESTDHGYQLALGNAVAQGHLPGFDFITQYGPAVAFASWGAWQASGSVVGEAVLCAVGYAAAIGIASVLFHRGAGTLAALLGCAVLILAFPRYYKWYYWLFPLIGLWCAAYHQTSMGPARRRVLYSWGLSVGLACLFRYDLGLQGGVFGALAILIADRGTGRGWREVSIFCLAAAALPLAFTGAIFYSRGLGQTEAFLRSVIDGAADSVVSYGIAPFNFVPSAGFAGNALPLLQVLLPVTCLAGLFLAWPRRAGDADPADHRLRCAALCGLGVFAQALHRADVQHLLQVLPPDIIVLALLARRLPRVAGGLLATIAAGAILLLPGTGADLAPVSRDPRSAWRDLAALPDGQDGQPVADMARALTRHLPPGGTVMLAMPMSHTPLLVFAQRRQPGIFPLYEPGMFASPYWLARNQAALSQREPDLLLALQPGIDDGEPAPYIAGLSAAWRRDYVRTVHSNARFVLLARP